MQGDPGGPGPKGVGGSKGYPGKKGEKGVVGPSGRRVSYNRGIVAWSSLTYICLFAHQVACVYRLDIVSTKLF